MNMKYIQIVFLTIVLVSWCSAFKIILHYPTTDKGFTIRGSGCGHSWDSGIWMQQISIKTWEIDVICPTNYNYFAFKPLLGGDLWSVGQNFAVSLTHYQNPNKTVEIYPWFFNTKGQYFVIENVYSPQLNNYRDVALYLPPSYYENTERPYYPTLLMHDGQNVFNDSTAFGGVSWRAAETLDRCAVYGLCSELIVIAPYNTVNRTAEYTYSEDPEYPGTGKGDKYINFLLYTLYPMFQKKYKIAHQDDAAILGSSLGGLISCYAAWTRPEAFKRGAGCMSSSFWWNNQDFNNKILVQYPHPQLFYNNGSKAKPDFPTITPFFYIDSGTSGPDNDGYEQTKEVVLHIKSMSESGIMYYVDKDGRHNERYWGNRFYIPISNLFPPLLWS